MMTNNIAENVLGNDLYAHNAIWMHSRNRGFHDLGSDMVEEVLSTIETNLPSAVVDWDIDEDGTWCFNFKHVQICLHPSSQVPTFLVPQIIPTSSAWATTSLQQLKDSIDRLLEVHSSRLSSFRHVVVLILQILEEKSPNEGALFNESSQFDEVTVDEEVSEDSVKYICEPVMFSDTITEHELLGTDLSGLQAMIPDEYSVLTIEPVRSKDLTRKWLRFQKEIRTSANKEGIRSLRTKCHPHMKVLENQKVGAIQEEDLISEMVKPFLTFHGTTRSNALSIIRHGFVMPGTILNGKLIGSPRTGVVYQRGIYSSPSAEFALSFLKCHRNEPVKDKQLPGLRLLVCATLMGRTYGGRDVHGQLKEGHDAHVSGEFEYIVHDPRAILPCYVIHLDLVSEQARKAILRVQQDPRLARFCNFVGTQKLPGDIQREQEAKKQAALKWFPYGFGPSIGTQFKIEEVGPVDEDEEPHGRLVYQEMSKMYGRNYGRVLTWMEIIQEDDGLLVEMFKEDSLSG